MVTITSKKALALAMLGALVLSACGKEEPLPVPQPQPVAQQPQQNCANFNGGYQQPGCQMPFPQYQGAGYAQWTGPNGQGYAQWMGGSYNNYPVYYYPQQQAYYVYQPQRSGYVQWNTPYSSGGVQWNRY